MTRYLLDTGIMGDLINRRRSVDVQARQAQLRGDILGTCEPVVAELFFGVEYSKTRDINLKRLQRALNGVRCWPFDRRAAQEYGRLAAELKHIGRPMQQIDVMVAAVALSLGNCIVVTADSDLAAVPGLKVEDWRS